MSAFGIDFGTTNCVVAELVGGVPDVLRLDAGARGSEWVSGPFFDRLVPSVFGVRPDGDGERELVGWAAKLTAVAKVEAVKRVIAGDEHFELGSRSWSTQQITAMLFRSLRDAVRLGGGDLDDAVVTIPANSPGRARYLTRACAGAAGIRVAALLNEPTAAALAYARRHPDVRRVLVYDFGGGTLDVTVLDVAAGVFRERASSGIAGLGGMDLDGLLRDHVLAQLPPPDDWTAYQWHEFGLEVERAKIRLSWEREVAVSSPAGIVSVAREDFERLVEPVVTRSLEPVTKCLDDLGVPGSSMDAVLMVGGSSRIPYVRDRVEELLGRPLVDEGDCEPLTVVAQGAAVAAGILDGSVDDVTFRVVTEHALGTVIRDRETGRRSFAPVINRNRLLPASAEETFRPNQDGATSISFVVVEGDPDLPVGDPSTVELATLALSIDPPRPRDEAEFRVTYRYDVSGVLHVSAVDCATGRVLLEDDVDFLDSDEVRRRRELDFDVVRDAPTQARLTPAPPQPVTPEEGPASEAVPPAGPVFVVDGSNLACLGRPVQKEGAAPSYAQLQAAVADLKHSFSTAAVHVVVDANLAHLLAPDERTVLDDDIAHNRVMSAPGGAIGKGDAVVCALAAKLGAAVVSNDSFKERHDEHPWLFEDDRLYGATRSGDTWIFTPRRPVGGRRPLLSRRPRPDATPDAVRAGSAPGASPTPRATPAAAAARTVSVWISSSGSAYHSTDECGALRTGRARWRSAGGQVGQLRVIPLTQARQDKHPPCLRCA